MARRYTLSNLKLALSKPSLVLYEVEHVVSRVLFRLKYGAGTDIMAEDWDNLIILDACRSDYFFEHNEISGDFTQVVSQASNSKQFIDRNFAGRELHDTIYITANPFVERLSDGVFFKIYYTELFDKWDDSLKTIPPEAVTEATVRMQEQHPDKRLIAHFMQPHTPFIGPTGRELVERHEFGIFNPELKESAEFDIQATSLPNAVNDGPITETELRQAYRENVQIAIENAKDLVEQLHGKTVITADHGEMLGERILVSKDFGHADTYTPELRVVPWHIVNSADRKDITEDEPQEFARLEDEIRESRLSALGYR